MNIDIEQLLQPISDQAICGEDLSFSNEFHEIKKAKTQDDPLLDMGDWVAEPKQADWSFVSAKCIDVLTQKSKDIRLLTWLSEAWSQLYGYEGVARSLELSHRMLSNYWKDIHPEIEDDDLDQRLGLLQGLTSQLPALIKRVPLINSAPFYSIYDYEKLLHQQNVRLKNADDYGSSQNHPELEQFEQSLFNTSKSFQYNNYQFFLEILTHWDTLKQVLDQLMQLDAPSFANTDSQLEDIHKTLKKIYKADAFLMSEDTPDMNQDLQFQENNSNINSAPTANIQAAVTQQSFQPQPQSHLQNREQAMRVLKDIADYFQANEPHSPVSYMLQKTIKWSQMPLHEWLAQVIKNDNNPLESVHELLGVKNSNESNEW
ncbi:type VI secretion system protein TssA [Acinetobacter sp. DSM 11652]|uniref:type VI secretion system protein TssA n=1 Tax=Acinetobacter sp. DSM 11652 TaxID=346222 RepID=UPI0008BE4E88|nr:type VI secretion system protein TssA [Acinetobacter sp. DSM 11652]SEL59543.1 type VI secretion system protein ImpA [Acinetobacter sp. DSM 11652]